MTTAPYAPFTAAGSAIGYLYQCRYALLLFLRRLKDDDAAQLAMEKFDDISFEKAGSPTDLIQTKHHLGTCRSLVDSSADLWKTFRVWSESVKNGTASPANTLFTIVTSATAAPGTAAELLRDGTSRDADRAHSQLVTVAKRMKGVELKTAREAFLALPEPTSKAMINSVYVIDHAPGIVDVARLIQRELSRAARPEHLPAFLERLEGWWFAQVISHLSGSNTKPVTGNELARFVDDLRESFTIDSLQIDFRDAMPPDITTVDDRTFVKQLRLISFLDRRIRWARVDYYRAYAQRSRWLKDNLLALPQLLQYDAMLTEEWERERDRLNDAVVGPQSADDAIKQGVSLYEHCYTMCHPIRANCTAPYVGRGSYHMLSDRKLVGWHPEYERLLGDSLKDGGTT